MTVFLRCMSDTTFEVSRPILYSTVSTESGGKGGVSIRECFLHLASLASSDMYSYPNTYGKSLVSHFLQSYSSMLDLLCRQMGL